MDIGVFLVSPKVFYKTKKTFGKTKNTKENKKRLSAKPKNKVVKGFRPTLVYGFGCFLFFGFLWVFTKANKYSGKPKIQKKTKENKLTFGKTTKTKFSRFQTHPWILVCFFGFPEGFYRTKKNLRENQKYKRQPKKTKKTSGKTKKTKSLKVSDPPLDIGLFVFLVAPKVFTKPKKLSGKPKIQKTTKENQK